jgi:DNA polymerase III delta prime subunit
MQGALLIFGGTKKQRLAKITEIAQKSQINIGKVNNPDILKISPEKGKSSIGIEKAREIKKFLGQKPYENVTKCVVIEEAPSLTIQAQNALLKALEELPNYASIILECSDKNGLIETAISRCQQIRIIGKIQEKVDAPSWEKIKNLAMKARLDLAEKLAQKERSEVIALLDIWINCERDEMKKADTMEILLICKENLAILMAVRNDLKYTNVNLALGTDYLLLNLKGKNDN